MKGLSNVILLCGIALLTVQSCRAISSLLHDEEVVAEVGRHMLYRSEVDNLIPDGASEEDSLRFALQYINSWASDIVFLDIAEEQLSKEELDVTAELEEYRRSLLKYRYEQRYINERLDTLVSESQIDEYYQSHIENFVLEIPIVRARFLRISADSPNLEIIKKKMCSSGVYCEKFDGTSLTAATVAVSREEIGEAYAQVSADLLSSMKNGVIEREDAYGKVNVAYVVDFMPAGEIPPVEYCRDRIKNIILSVRKQTLVTSLEQDLLEDAREKGKFKIF